MTTSPSPLALYIHWPFCAKKCPYCDFNSHVREQVDTRAWQNALLTELSTMASALDTPHYLRSIFFGGGTPSLMSPDIVDALIAKAHTLWSVDSTIEITLEANPGSSETAKFNAFRQAGVNRLSLGVQSLHDSALTTLGRIHSAKEAIQAIEMARALFPRYTFDLIYTRQGQTLDAWEEELIQALRFARGHLSLYQLTIEPNTAFAHAFAKGELILPEEEASCAFYTRTQEIMHAHGLPAYEVSNHAAPGQESRHNLSYWTRGAYMGIGPGAHGRLDTSKGRLATKMIDSPERWLEQVKTTGHGLESELLLSEQTLREERIMTGLRLSEGIDRADISWVSAEKTALLEEWGLVMPDHTRLRLTPQGRLLLNRIIAELMIDCTST